MLTNIKSSVLKTNGVILSVYQTLIQSASSDWLSDLVPPDEVLTPSKSGFLPHPTSYKTARDDGPSSAKPSLNTTCPLIWIT